MFNAPELFLNIPDIAQIYEINDTQAADLDSSIQQMDDDIFLDSMSEDVVKRWESILDIVPNDDDTIADRRFRIKSKVLEKLPYTYSVILRKISALCSDYVLELSEDKLSCDVKIGLSSKKMRDDVEVMLEEMLPLNMIYSVIILWNTYEMVSTKTHSELTSKTYKEWREEIIS